MKCDVENVEFYSLEIPEGRRYESSRYIRADMWMSMHFPLSLFFFPADEQLYVTRELNERSKSVVVVDYRSNICA